MKPTLNYIKNLDKPPHIAPQSRKESDTTLNVEYLPLTGKDLLLTISFIEENHPNLSEKDKTALNEFRDGIKTANNNNADIILHPLWIRFIGALYTEAAEEVTEL